MRSLTIVGSAGICADNPCPASQWICWKSEIRSSVFNVHIYIYIYIYIYIIYILLLLLLLLGLCYRYIYIRILRLCFMSKLSTPLGWVIPASTLRILSSCLVWALWHGLDVTTYVGHSGWVFKLYLYPSHHYCTDGPHKAQTVLCSVSYIYLTNKEA